MNQAGMKRARRWRWGWAFFFVLLAHAALVFWGGEPVRARGPFERPQPLLHVPADEAGARRVGEIVALAGPTLFALPSPRGFSGGAWLNFSAPAVTLSNWTETPIWLSLREEDIALTLDSFAATNRVSNDGLLDGLRVTLPYEAREPSVPLAGSSTVVVEGGLARRAVVFMPAVPVMTNADLLARTVVGISVNGDGAIESVELAAESGLASADELAVRLARGTRFAPLALDRKTREAAPPARGRLVFSWHVTPPVLTNGVAMRAP
jgi:hypothetical protein